MNEQIKQRITQLNNGEVPNGYEKTEIGTFPVGWKTTTLDKLLEFKNGVNADKEKYNSGVKMISVMDILTDSPIYYDKIKGQVDIDEKTLDTYSVTYGDILFQRSSETVEDAGKSNVYLDKDRTATYSGFVIRGKKKSDYNPYFLNEALRIGQVRNQIIRNAAGSQHINVGQDSLAKIIIPLASDAEQSKIAEILMKWDEAIELQEQYINILEARKRYLMEELLLPQKDWEVASLGQIVSKEKGKAVKISENGKIPILDMDYIETGLFSNYTDDDGILASKEDILVLWDGASAGTLLTNVEGIVGSTFALLKIKSRQILPLYLYYWLTIQNQKNSALREGSGIPHMPKDYLKMQKVCYPDISKQTKISKTLALSEVEILLNNEKLKIFVEQRKTLQQYLLNGIVRV